MDDELRELEEQEDEALQSANLMTCVERCFGGKDEERLNDLKKELEIDWHTKDIERLQADYGTMFDVVTDKDDSSKWTVPKESVKGLTSLQVASLTRTWGENRLTPPKTKPEWVKFCEQLTGFFSLLLWAGGILCFVGYGLQGSADNLYLGVVLCVVVFLTGVFGYVQEKKSSDLMDSFKNMMPQACTSLSLSLFLSHTHIYIHTHTQVRW